MKVLHASYSVIISVKLEHDFLHGKLLCAKMKCTYHFYHTGNSYGKLKICLELFFTFSKVLNYVLAKLFNKHLVL